MRHLLDQIPYEDLTPHDVKLEKKPKSKMGYVRPPKSDQSFVTEVY